MSRNICQAFLRDSIANELDVRFKPAALGRDVLDDRDPGRLRELAAQRIERAVQAEVFQRIGAQPPGDAANLIEAGPHRLLRIFKFAANRLRRTIDHV